MSKPLDEAHFIGTLRKMNRTTDITQAILAVTKIAAHGKLQITFLMSTSRELEKTSPSYTSVDRLTWENGTDFSKKHERK